MIEFKKHKGSTTHLLIYWEVIDLLGIEIGDEVMLNRVDNDLYIYRLNSLGPRYGSGYKVTKSNTQNKGFTVYTDKLLNYSEPGDKYEVDKEYLFDELNEVEMYLMEKID